LVFDLKRTSFFLKRALVFLYKLNTSISFLASQEALHKNYMLALSLSIGAFLKEAKNKEQYLNDILDMATKSGFYEFSKITI
jgi:hypothetical protein